MIVGALAEATGWRRVASGRANVWRLMPVILAAMGVLAVLVRRPAAATDVSNATALSVGAASGLALYVGTRVFVWLADRWPPFRRHVVEKYREAAEVSMRESLLLSLLVMVPAEELFWRGLFQGHLDQTVGVLAAGFLSWLAYVAVNAASASLPIVAGAVVGGALWVGLFAWSGGVLASLASHMLWTGLMLALPPGVGRRGDAG
jgi:hypothetical protein